ncbi:MAG: hypothetical protein Kow00109_30000 [Acidobacteriota bacterium]
MWKRTPGWLTLVLGALLFGQGEILDLTNRSLPPEPHWRVGEGFVSSAGELAPPLELSLTLGEEVYRFDEEFMFEVAIKNVTEVPFPIPWEPDWRRIVPEERPAQLPKGYRNAGLFLTADLAGQQVTLVSFGLDGSEEVPGSIRVLAPSETVRIRAKGNWGGLTGLTGTKPAPIEVSLCAEWVYFYGMPQTLLESKGVWWSSTARSELQEVTVEP